MAESFWDYLMRITDGASGVSISRAAEVDAGNVSRWKTGKTRPSAESVVKIARVWQRPPVEALVASGHLAANEVGAVVEVALSTADLSDDDLLAEVRRRMTGARNDITQEPTPTPSSTEAEGEKTPAGNPRDGGTDPEGQATDDARPNVWREKPGKVTPLKPRRKGRDFDADPIIEEPTAAYNPPGLTDAEQELPGEEEYPDPEGPEGGA